MQSYSLKEQNQIVKMLKSSVLAKLSPSNVSKMHNYKRITIQYHGNM
jgi:hypothetical protein